MLRCLLIAIALGVCTAQVSADEYPSSPIRIICGYSPGSPPDIVARAVGARMAQTLGQQVVVENRTGAGSNLAAAMVARAPKDGYTLLVGSSANAINAVVSANSTFDLIKDFAPISLLTSTSNVLSVSPSVGAKSVRELIDLARSKPGKLSFGSSGVASSTHLSLELFKQLAKVDIVHVPYAGSPQAVIDLLAGRIDGMFSPSATVMPYVKDGKLAALASTGRQRAAAVPDLPTMIESGVPDFESLLWQGLMAPAGVPANALAKLSRAASEAIRSEEVVKVLKANDVQVIGSTPEEFNVVIRNDIARWTAVVAAAGIKK